MEHLLCKNRIKPKLLRDIKTEALLVFIRTTLEDFFKEYENKQYKLLENKEDNNIAFQELNKLYKNLENHVVNSTYLNTIIHNIERNSYFKLLAKKEEPLMVYYDSLVKALESKLNNGSEWIPELIVLCLLSEWIIEEEKSTFLYPFLKDINYLLLLEQYEKVKFNFENEKKDIIMQMYKLSSYIIFKLKNKKFKFQTHKKRKKR